MRNNKFINSTGNRKPIKGLKAKVLHSWTNTHFSCICKASVAETAPRGSSGEETQTLRVKAAEGEAVLHRRLQNLFLHLKIENTQDKNNTFTVSEHVSKSHSRDILPWHALLFPQTWTQSLPWELWQKGCWINWFCFKILAWFSREKGFSRPFLWTTPPPRIEAKGSLSREQYRGEVLRVQEGKTE